MKKHRPPAKRRSCGGEPPSNCPHLGASQWATPCTWGKWSCGGERKGREKSEEERSNLTSFMTNDQSFGHPNLRRFFLTPLRFVSIRDSAVCQLTTNFDLKVTLLWQAFLSVCVIEFYCSVADYFCQSVDRISVIRISADFSAIRTVREHTWFSCVPVGNQISLQLILWHDFHRMGPGTGRSLRYS